MEVDEIDEVVAALRAGRSFRVPFHTTLFPETEPIESVLAVGPDGGFTLTTTFREHAPGHGWSCEQHETEPRTEARVRDSLARAPRGDVVAR